MGSCCPIGESRTTRRHYGSVLGIAWRVAVCEKGIKSNHMSEEYETVYVDKPEESVWKTIGQGIREYNTQQAGDRQYQVLCFVLRGPDEAIVGGVIGETYWDWFHLDLLWVKEELRGRGYGHRLLTLAEQEARRRGAKNAYLDTFSFQAPDFYERHGYQVFGELPNYPAGHQRYFLAKQL
jgi:ribosomal protein S18 acetylase RimI-like enzyme